MNYMPEPVETKTYVGSLVENYQPKYPEEIKISKSELEQCYTLTNYEKEKSPSVQTEFKTGDSCLEDLDTNADTTSVPESEFVSEYFDIYGQNENINKVLTTLGTQNKWEDINRYAKEGDTTTVGTTTASETGFKLTPFHSSTLFFEDDFRYVTSKNTNNGKPYSMISDYSEKQETHTLQPTYTLQNQYKIGEQFKEFYGIQSNKNQENKDIFTVQTNKDELMEKVELASTSFAQITNTMANLSNPSNPVGTNIITNNLITTGIINNGITTPGIFGNAMQPTTYATNFINPFEVKKPAFFMNTQISNINTMMETDLYLSPSLTNKCYNLVSNYPVTTNYCVYIGADYNKLVCSCNMNRQNGSNSHSTNCNVVAGGVELSTESWPILKASQMHTLINTWDKVMMNYKKCTPKQEYNMYVQEEYKPPIFKPQEEDKGIKTTYATQGSMEQLKNVNNLISEITGIKFNLEKSDQFSLRNAVSEHLRTDELIKRRKPNKPKITEQTPLGYTREIEIAPMTTSNEETKIEKKEQHQTNTEKVSGVWYDTNRHLWRVVYMKGNKRKTQGFSSLKLGYEEARRKAIQMRQEMVAMRHSDKM